MSNIFVQHVLICNINKTAIVHCLIMLVIQKWPLFNLSILAPKIDAPDLFCLRHWKKGLFFRNYLLCGRYLWSSSEFCLGSSESGGISYLSWMTSPFTYLFASSFYPFQWLNHLRFTQRAASHAVFSCFDIFLSCIDEIVC